MAKPEDRKNIVNKLVRSGFTSCGGNNGHDVFRKPGANPVSLPRSKQISPGIVRQVNNAIKPK